MNLIKIFKKLFKNKKSKKKSKIRFGDPIYTDNTTGQLTITANNNNSNRQIGVYTGSGTITVKGSHMTLGVYSLPSTVSLTFPTNAELIKDFMKKLYKKFGAEQVEQLMLKDITFFIGAGVLKIESAPFTFQISNTSDNLFSELIKKILPKRNIEKVANMKLKEFFILVTAKEKDEKERDIYKTILKKLL